MKMQTALALFIIACTGLARAQDAYYAPDKAAITALEGAIVMPSGARPLGEYARYYVGVVRDGHHAIQAEFVHAGPAGSAGIHLVSGPGQFPLIADGGCSIINILYDADAKRLTSMRCNGFA